MGFSHHGKIVSGAVARTVEGLINMQVVDVLFLCETNSATSLMAEALLNKRGDSRVRAFSAGSRPATAMLAEARMALSQRAISTAGLEPKSWTFFSLPGGIRPHIVVDLATVTWTEPECAKLAEYVTLRWPLRDPALVERRADRRAVTEAVLGALSDRIQSELMRRIDSVRQMIASDHPQSMRWA